MSQIADVEEETCTCVPAEDRACSSEPLKVFCQHLVTSLLGPDMDLAKTKVLSCLSSTIKKTLLNVEERIISSLDVCKVIVEDSSPEQPKDLLKEFTFRMNALEDWAQNAYLARNANAMRRYSKFKDLEESGELSQSDSGYSNANRTMRAMCNQLGEELFISSTGLVDRLISKGLITDEERDRIMSGPNERARALVLLRIVAPKLDMKLLEEVFIPALEEDHFHLAEGLRLTIIQVLETSASERKCAYCRFYQMVEVESLAPELRRILPTPALESDITNPHISNSQKVKLLRKHLTVPMLIQCLARPYPGLHRKFLKEKVETWECRCHVFQKKWQEQAVALTGFNSKKLKDKQKVSFPAALEARKAVLDPGNSDRVDDGPMATPQASAQAGSRTEISGKFGQGDQTGYHYFDRNQEQELRHHQQRHGQHNLQGLPSSPKMQKDRLEYMLGRCHCPPQDNQQQQQQHQHQHQQQQQMWEQQTQQQQQEQLQRQQQLQVSQQQEQPEQQQVGPRVREVRVHGDRLRAMPRYPSPARFHRTEGQGA